MLKVIGAGFSRTGTSSLKRALELLDFGPCYHMHEVFLKPEHASVWETASAKTPNWQELFQGYTSAVDAPTCHYWKQIHNAFEGSKVILTERDPDEWYDSFYATVYQILSKPALTPSSEQATIDMAKKLELEQIFSNKFEDRDHAVSVYLQHNQTVKDSMSPQKLLVYNVSSGWEALCDFLEVKIPDVEFPHSNARAKFQSRVGLS